MNPLKQFNRSSTRAIAVLVPGLALCAFAVTFFGGANPPDWARHAVGMKAGAAACFLMNSLALWLWSGRPLSRQARMAAKGLGEIVCGIGVLTFLEHFTGANLGMGGWPEGIAWPAVPGRVTLEGTLSFTLLGLAFATLDWTVRRRIRPAEYFAFSAGALELINLISYIYDTRLAAVPPGYIRLPSTAIIVILLAWGVLAVRPTGGLILVLMSRTGTGRLLRRLLAFVTIVLPLMGRVELEMEKQGLHSSEFGVVLLVVGSLSLFTLSVLTLGAGLVRAETLRRKAEHYFRMREADFRATFEQAVVGLSHVTPSGRFKRVNARLCEIIGYSPEELTALTFQEISYPEDLETDLAHYRRVLAGEISHYVTEKRYIRKDGSLIWVNLTVAALRGSSGEVKYFIAVVEDISERRKVLAELEAANKAKDRFISVISHELRTPLTPVLAILSESAREGQSLTDPVIIEMMRRNVEHEASIINDLLELTRITAPAKFKLDLRPVDLHLLISEVFQGIAQLLQAKGISGHLVLAAPHHTVNGDPVRLRQVLINLLDNAIKFTLQGGSIAVETRMRDGGERIEVRVADTGIGIEAANLARIFSPFEQVEQSMQRRYGGLGLGLPIVKGLVEAHGGTVRVESTVGHGSVFIFDLGLTRKTPFPAANPAARRASLPLHILLVEDHADTRTTLQHLLQRRGHRVHTSVDIKQAVAALLQQPFDLVISDIGLPDGTGLDLPKILQASGHPIPGIALSGFGTEDDIRKSLLAGFARHITKPVDMNALDTAMAEIIERSPGGPAQP